MKDYLYDYKKSSFKTVNNSGKKNYYIKINQDYIEITEDVYKTCKSSYDKLRYTYKQEVAINKLLLKDLTSTIYSEIDQLNSTDRKIAILFFIYEYNISEISRILDLPRKTFTYRFKFFIYIWIDRNSIGTIDEQNGKDGKNKKKEFLSK